MQKLVDSNTLHRTAKYFMDNGQVKTHSEAMALLNRFGLTIFVGNGIAASVHEQTALLTLVNIARRTLLGGIEVVGLPNAPCISPLARGLLHDAVGELGATLAQSARPAWPSAFIGDVSPVQGPLPSWQLVWNGWRGGVIPLRGRPAAAKSWAMELAPVAAAACCAGEVFAYHAGDHPMAGRRTVGLSLWQPGKDWLVCDDGEPCLAYLPSRLWLIGLGNLGQAYAWALACLPYVNRGDVQLTLQDFDRISASNESTSMLAFAGDIGRRKARVVARWLETRGFETFIVEQPFGEWTRRGGDEPQAALCGVDNALARAALGKVGFGLVVEAGLGGGLEAFRSFSVHTFPASRSPEEIWSRQIGQVDEPLEDRPAYQALKQGGMDNCGLAQLASRTVAVPFVGAIAACLAVSEFLRRLNGGGACEIISGSAASLADMDWVSLAVAPYSHGHVPAAGIAESHTEKREYLTAGELVA
jgi:hypothetical protein